MRVMRKQFNFNCYIGDSTINKKGGQLHAPNQLDSICCSAQCRVRAAPSKA